VVALSSAAIDLDYQGPPSAWVGHNHFEATAQLGAAAGSVN